MSRAWSLRAVPMAMLLIAACSEAPTTPLGGRAEIPAGGLAFLFPAFRPEMLVHESREVWSDPPATGPAKVIEEAEEAHLLGEEGEIPPDAEAAIWNARTSAGIGPTEAWAEGSHEYQGNKSRIETTLRVYADGAEVGRQAAVRQADWIFWFDFGIPKSLSVFVRHYVNRSCGFAASASSQHDAWWEAVPGASIANFGKVVVSSQSDYNEQPECSPPPDGGGGGGSGAYDEGSVCILGIWYDMDTGEVLAVEVLWCGEIGG